MATAPTLICIPDISGFTEFMSKVDFKLGSKVIPSLLNNIIYSNDIGLKVSEIEGDAVLFYRQGNLPTLKELIVQCKPFYSDFYSHLESLKSKYASNNHSNSIPAILGLKIILHFGREVAPVAIGKHIKLMGEDVIVAHRLLKNAVPIAEYILISEELLAQYTCVIDNEVEWAEISTCSIEDEHIGKVSFNYIPLKPLL
ncbi:DUF2652 domain-containing protein [Ulvibacterium marinum]|uniref:DUF2652 domain-containing protein n=1 Tax=Ulvibacterium marinum TaxID=2419782 RepID=A0A3B0CC12_9FLAO|nr:DUF2652 domain-containing protein [Ulvibacterium marinum]RKN83493.1 DUF2652 domain-containing protein [Ulvibacterium marinum]